MSSGSAIVGPRLRPLLLAVGLALPPLLAALAGAAGPRTVRLDLGPGDGPYVSGFAPEWEIEGGHSLHWSRPRARLSLPLAYEGEAALALRFGPPPGGPVRVDVTVGERPLDGFECCRHRALQGRVLPAPASRPTSLDVHLRVAGPDVKDLGLWLDAVELGLGPEGRVKLAGPARFRPAALVAMVFALLLAMTAPTGWAALLTLPVSLLLTGGLLRDPWLVHRLLTGLPAATLVLGLLLLGLARFLASSGSLTRKAAAWAPALALLVFVARAAAFNHPGYYHPDLASHARLTKALREGGVGALLAPAGLFEGPGGAARAGATGFYLLEIGGKHYPHPYTLVPHLFLAVLPLDFDTTATGMRLFGIAFSVLPIVLLAALARTWGAPEWAGGLLATAPTAVAEVGLAAVPALAGHVLDLLLLLFLTTRLHALPSPRTVVSGAMLLAAAMLTYVATPVTSMLLLACLFPQVWADPEGGRRKAGALFAMGALGAALALVAYYRDFVPGALVAARAALRSEGASEPPRVGRVDGTLALWLLPLALPLALAGLRRLLAVAGEGRKVFVALVLSLGLVTFLRLLGPGFFGHVHLALAVTPLLCLGAATALEALRVRGGRRAVVALGLLGLLVVQGLALQARALAEHVGRVGSAAGQGETQRARLR